MTRILEDIGWFLIEFADWLDWPVVTPLIYSAGNWLCNVAERS